MKVRTTNTHHVADARSLGGGEKRFPKNADGRRRAKEYLAHVQAEHDQRGAFTNPTNTPTVSQLAEEFLREELRRVRRGEQGMPHYDSKVVMLTEEFPSFTFEHRRLGDVRCGEISSGDFMRELMPQFLDGQAQATAKRKLGIVKQMFQWAVETDMLRANPAAVRMKKRKQKKKRPIVRIRKSIISSIILAADPRYTLAIEFSAYTGLRSGELRALTWEDIAFNAGTNHENPNAAAAIVDVNKAVKKDGTIGEPKSESGYREIPIGHALVGKLRAHRDSQVGQVGRNNLVFPNEEGGVWDTANLRNRGLHPACDAAGVDRIRWHDLRHFFASLLIYDLEAHEGTITTLMGHHSLAFTIEQYGHWFPDARREAEIASRIETALTA